ncbi:MAG: hypothetical protein KatS3mg110_0442 [Pirellulaceae bacterium]|nr:MAG: hypothetical protein KatS3mg110_0442 [Pirellulaceae bacterium]
MPQDVRCVESRLGAAVKVFHASEGQNQRGLQYAPRLAAKEVLDLAPVNPVDRLHAPKHLHVVAHVTE